MYFLEKKKAIGDCRRDVQNLNESAERIAERVRDACLGITAAELVVERIQVNLCAGNTLERCVLGCVLSRSE